MNSRRKFLINGGIATSALLASTPLKTFARFSSPFSSYNGNRITLLHTFDLHRTVYACPSALQQATSIIADLKKNGNCLLLDTGTNYSGNLLQQEEDSNTLSLMKSMGYDVTLTGSAAFAGSLVTGNMNGNIQPYKIINKGAIRIGVIGAWMNSDDKHDFANPISKLTEIATMLKEEQRCNLVICLSNYGYENKTALNDTNLATQSANIDMIIGSQPAGASGPAPAVVLNKMRQEVVINNAGHGDIVLGKIEVGFDTSGKKNHISFSNVFAKSMKKKLSAPCA